MKIGRADADGLDRDMGQRRRERHCRNPVVYYFAVGEPSIYALNPVTLGSWRALRPGIAIIFPVLASMRLPSIYMCSPFTDPASTRRAAISSVTIEEHIQ